MGLRIEYEAKARKELQWLPQADRLRVYRKIIAYADDPAATAHDVVPCLARPMVFTSASATGA